MDFIFEEPSVVAKTYSIKLLSKKTGAKEKFSLNHLREAPVIFEEIYVSFYNGMIHEVEVKTGADRTLRIRLKDVRKNTEISVQEFEFSPTKDTDVVRELTY